MTCQNCAGNCGGECPHKKKPLTTRLTPFRMWTVDYSPVIPKFYWDVYSQEERIKHIVLELDRLRAYINYIFCELENLANELEEALERAENLVEELQKIITELKETIKELREQITIVNTRLEELDNELDEVRRIANAAKNSADAAKSAASKAQTAADNAQATANAAKNSADAANSAASKAQTAADNAQATANAAKNSADAANSVAGAASTDASQAKEIAQAAQQAVAVAQATLANHETRLATLEKCCRDIQAELDALEVLTADNPIYSVANTEYLGQVSSGPIGSQNPAMYASVLGFDIPFSHTGGKSFKVTNLGITARVGGNLAYVQSDGTKKSLSGITLFNEDGPLIPEIIGYYFNLTKRGLRVRIQFSQSLWRAGSKPDGTWLEEPIMNGTPVAVATWLDGEVIY